MKYRNEEGQWEDLLLEPTGDTLPIGTIVDYDGTTVPHGYEEVSNNEDGTMKIKKISQIAGVVGGIFNSKDNSTTDTYSCNYINKLNTPVRGNFERTDTGFGLNTYYRVGQVVFINGYIELKNYNIAAWAQKTFATGLPKPITAVNSLPLANDLGDFSNNGDFYVCISPDGELYLNARNKAISNPIFYVNITYITTD